MASTQSNGSDHASPRFGLVIDNEDKHTESSFPVFDPITGSTVHLAPAATQQQALQAVESAQKAFESWRETTPIKRREILNKAVQILQARQDELVNAMVVETGAKKAWAAFNISIGTQFVMEGAGMVTQVKGELLQSNDEGTIALVYKEPCGVVLGIAPWNAPIILGIRAFITPLVCGNTCVLKASEASAYTQYLLVDCFRQAGLPAGVLNFICCPRADAGPITEAMIAHSAVTRVNFTGSTPVGKIISAMCAKYLKPVVLELGGKAPMVVLKDANLEDAVKAAAFGAMMHQGQICMSTERIIVDRTVSSKFQELFKAKVDSMYAADPSVDASAPLGSLIDATAGARVHKLVNNAVEKGAEIVGGKVSASGAIVQPVALSKITTDMDLYHQESFGPVVTLFEFDSVEEAINIANDTEHGLVASVFSTDILQAIKVARRIKSGSCHINGPTVHDEPHLPLGGQKASGYGKFGGTACINEFTEDRVITISEGGHSFPI